MHVSLKPVVFQPVPIVRPVAKVTRAPRDTVAEAVTGEPPLPVSADGNRRSPRRRPKPKGGEEVRAATRDPGTPLAHTLALLHLERAFGGKGNDASS